MKKLGLSQYIHNRFWETERPCESQFVNHFCCKSRTNSQKWTAWHWHFQNRNLRGVSLILILKRLRDWQGMMEKEGLNNLKAEQQKLCSYFDPSVICCLYFSSTQMERKAMSITFSAPEETRAKPAGDFLEALLQKCWGVTGLRQEGFHFLPASPLQCWTTFLNHRNVENCSCESSDKSQKNRARKSHKGSFNFFSSLKAGCTTSSFLTTPCLTCM